MTNSAVLVLNRNFQPIHITNAKRAFALLYLGVAEALDRQFKTFNFETWSQVSAELDDDVIHTIGRVIRVPRVIVLQMPPHHQKTRPPPPRHNIYMRDGNTCQYCGRGLPRTDLNLDHVIPRAQGGRTTWENVVCCCIDCNLAKGAMTPDQAHMKLLKHPMRPRCAPTFRAAGDKIRYREWLPFLDLPNASYWNVELEE